MGEWWGGFYERYRCRVKAIIWFRLQRIQTAVPSSAKLRFGKSKFMLFRTNSAKLRFGPSTSNMLVICFSLQSIQTQAGTGPAKLPFGTSTFNVLVIINFSLHSIQTQVGPSSAKLRFGPSTSNM